MAICEPHGILDESMAALPKPSGRQIYATKCLDASFVERHAIELWKRKLSWAEF